ncbi:GrpB family protein [Salinispirillum sp. LH 10-3-1]|uniref:GrpB family protein n=1 Tax=Salinispirillum sp. LH 10-3-1 TaxID=2952525 RepID=A0AB38YBQ6_9GAMM
MRLVEAEQCKANATDLFAKWKPIIESSIPDSRVEHIGSTAIAGALTKGDVDLYVEVPASAHADAVAAIQAFGFSVKHDTHRDSELCMLEKPDQDGLALQVVARGSKYEFFLLFRDALNGDAELVQRYNQLKQDAIGSTPEHYRAQKTSFIESVLQGPSAHADKKSRANWRA